jgi:glycosyltransferase involved in cell wall biosynthesis
MGGQKGIASFYGAFSKQLPVSLISVKGNATPENLNAEFLPILSNSKTRYFNPFVFFTIKKIIVERQSTHLIIEHPYLGWLGILAKWFLKVKLVVHSHNIEALRFKSTGKWWWGLLWHYERFIHRKADINFFISEEDKNFAIIKFKLKKEKCHTITYGFDFSASPTLEEKQIARQKLINTYQLPRQNKILLFNGTLDYQPNLDALKIILYEINPILKSTHGFEYTIIICGKNLPNDLNNLQNEKENNIVYAGFVDDITIYFKGADIFINPVTNGGGIKTKLVEALGYNLTCISTAEGAIGIPEKITGDKLIIVDHKNWKGFATSVINTNKSKGNIGDVFFNHFFWDKIAEKAENAIKQ